MQFVADRRMPRLDRQVRAGWHFGLASQRFGGRVAAAANIDLSLADKSRATLQELGGELIDLTEKARQHSRNITRITERMHAMTQEGVMAMQFEDIVTQMIERISQRTANVGNYLHAFLNLHQDQDEKDGLQRFRRRSEKLVQLLVDSQIKADAILSSASAHTALQQHDGDIELF